MIGKVYKASLKTLAFGLSLWVLIYTFIVIAEEFLSDYDIFDTVDSPAVVTEKFSKKGLIGTPSYYVHVDLNEANASTDIENRLSSWQFKRLGVGDEIKGHYIRGEHFFTTLDILIDSFILFIFFIIFLLLLVLLIGWPVSAFIEKRKKQNKLPEVIKTIYRRKNKSKKRTAKKTDSLFQKVFRKAFLPTTMVILLLTISGFLLNSVQKFLPIGKTQTEAIVVGSDSYGRKFYGSRHMTDPYYALDLVLKDEKQNEYRVVKEVTWDIYKKHPVGDTITISYMNGNPYNVFVPNYSLLSVWEIITYGRLLLYMMILTCLVLYFMMTYKKRRNNKE